MLGRAFGITSILLLGTFAGCISKGDAPADVTDTNDSGPSGFLSANDSTAAPDGRGELAAFKETNRTESNGTGAMVHKHDYWKGESRKHVADLFVPLIPFPVTPCKTSGGCSGVSGDTYPAGTAIADFSIPKPSEGGGLIYEGATAVEFTANYIHWGLGPSTATGDISQDPDHPNAHIFFDYLTTADEPGVFRTGGELKAGQPVVIDIKPTEADMPHQTKSLWIVRVYSDSTTLSFEMNLTLTAIKGNEVVNWPPHPDLYAEKSERLIFQGPVTMTSKGTVDSNIYGSDAGWVNPERILSWGTERIEIEVSSATLKTDVPNIPASGYVLEFHNATKPPLLGNGAQYGGRLVDEGSDGTTWHYSIDVSNDFDSYDTPYGDKSRWGFRFVPQFDNGGDACVDDRFLQQLLVGCQFVGWTEDYTLTIRAYGSPHTSELPDPAAG